MGYEKELAFVRDLLKKWHIASCILTEPEKRIDPAVDQGLRLMLFGQENYLDILENSLAQAMENTIYRFFDEYRCSYIFWKLPDRKDEYFYIGPYLVQEPEEEWLERKRKTWKLSEDQFQQFRLFYAGLPVLEDENWILALAGTLGEKMWGSKEAYRMEYVDYVIPDRRVPLPVLIVGEESYVAPASLAMMEKNYANEKFLMEAVSKGMLHQVTAVASSVFTNGTQQRMSDSLRNRKNYLIILNTLLRKAAEEGGVHPLHIDRESSRFAHKIENIRTMKQSLTLQEEMVRSYCQLVRQHSLSRYSYYVARAITLVQYDLSADLSLKHIAEELNVNPSYLSNLFHKECQCTLTEFVNRQRMERAIYLLTKSDKLVQEIAAECGIQDANYFIKIFKKHTGVTPKQYRENTRG